MLLLGTPVALFINSKRNKFLKSLQHASSKKELTIHLFQTNLIAKNLYHQFQTLNSLFYFRDNFYIEGVIKGNSFEYYELYSLFKRYGVMVIDADNYKPKFSNILIKKHQVGKQNGDFSLEWNDFNLMFDSRSKNPKEALEIVTPAFMENIFRICKKYKEVKFEYFETKDLQKNTLAFLANPACVSFKADTEIVIKNIECLALELLELKESL